MKKYKILLYVLFGICLSFYLENILASIAVISNYLDLDNLNEKFFFNYNLPQGRGDHKYIKIKKKKIHLIDESYNSNPLSLKFAFLEKSFRQEITTLNNIIFQFTELVCHHFFL